MGLNELRRETELSRCADCGEGYDLEPCNARHARIQQDRLRVRPAMGVSLKAIMLAVAPPRVKP